MTARIHTRGQRPDRLSRLPSSPRIMRRAGCPSFLADSRWRALPVEGSKAWRDRQPILSRLFNF